MLKIKDKEITSKISNAINSKLPEIHFLYLLDGASNDFGDYSRRLLD